MPTDSFRITNGPGALRAISATAGGYAVAAGASAALARLLPGPRDEATTWGLLIAPAVYAAVLLWAYAEPRLLRVAGAIWGAGALLAAGCLLAGRGG